MLNLLKLDFRNCTNNKKFKNCFLILFTISILSFVITCIAYFNSTSLDLISTNSMGLVLGGELRVFYHLILMIGPLVGAVMYSDSFIYEFQENIIPTITSRCNKKVYFISKVITIFVVTFISIFFIFSINEILTYIAIPNIGIRNDYGVPAYILLGNNTDEFFMQTIKNSSPIVYKFIIIAFNAIFISFTSILTFNLTLIFRIKSITVIIIVFLIINISQIILPIRYQVQMYLQCWPGDFNDFLKVAILWIILLVITFIVGIRKEII